MTPPTSRELPEAYASRETDRGRGSEKNAFRCLCFRESLCCTFQPQDLSTGQFVTRNRSRRIFEDKTIHAAFPSHWGPASVEFDTSLVSPTLHMQHKMRGHLVAECFSRRLHQQDHVHNLRLTVLLSRSWCHTVPASDATNSCPLFPEPILGSHVLIACALYYVIVILILYHIMLHYIILSNILMCGYLEPHRARKQTSRATLIQASVQLS